MRKPRKKLDVDVAIISNYSTILLVCYECNRPFINFLY